MTMNNRHYSWSDHAIRGLPSDTPRLRDADADFASLRAELWIITCCATRPDPLNSCSWRPEMKQSRRVTMVAVLGSAVSLLGRVAWQLRALVSPPGSRRVLHSGFRHLRPVP